MGPWGGFVTGLAENMEYVLTPAVIVVGIGGYTGAIFSDLFGIDLAAPVWWLLAYVVFVGLNIWGVEALRALIDRDAPRDARQRRDCP